MDKQFTASEVRQLAVTMGAMNLPTTRDMLLAYADSLEADERAQPFMYTWSKEPDRDGVFRKIPLYTHSTQAQPPAASVTDAVFPSHRACVPYENHPGKRIVGFVIDESHPWWGKCGLTEPLSALEAALAAQENPNG